MTRYIRKLVQRIADGVSPHKIVNALFENTARTLFHGTWKGNVASIKKIGLVGSIGEFVKEMYGDELAELERWSMSGEEDADSLVFFADKRDMSMCVGAMRFHISKKVPGFKSFHDVTMQDVKRHGALVIVKEIDVPHPKDDYNTKESGFHQRPKDDKDANYYAEYPLSVEPGDYYAYGDDGVGVDIVLTGNKMMQFLRRHGALRDFMQEKRSRAIAKLKKQGESDGPLFSNTAHWRLDAVAKVRKMTDEEILRLR